MDDLSLQNFIEAEARFRALAPRLPRDAVLGLAREVVERVASQAAALPPEARPAAEWIDAMCAALVGPDADAAPKMVRDLLREGVSVEAIYLGYLSAAAARLGEMWEDDSLSFRDVTLGAGRIYAAMRLAREALKPPRITRPDSVFFASVPGEEHLVGIRMAADLFRRAGWDVTLSYGETHDEILRQLRSSGSLLVGLSAAGKSMAPALARLILALRVSEPHALVLVAGRLVTTQPDLVQLMGPEAMAETIPQALAEMTRLSQQLHGPGPADRGA